MTPDTLKVCEGYILRGHIYNTFIVYYYIKYTGMYVIHANLCFVLEIQTEYKPRLRLGLYEGLYFPDKAKSGMYYTYVDPV